MTPILQKIIYGHRARLKVMLTAGIVWLISWVVAKTGFNNGADWSAQIATFAAVAAGYVMEAIAAKVSAEGVKDIQRILPQPLKEDGLAGEQTIAAVTEVVQAAEGGPFNT